MNVAEEVVVEELSPYKELFNVGVPEQGLVAAATSCVFSSYQPYCGQTKVTNSIDKTCNKRTSPTDITEKSNRVNYEEFAGVLMLSLCLKTNNNECLMGSFIIDWLTHIICNAGVSTFKIMPKRL